LRIVCSVLGLSVAIGPMPAAADCNALVNGGAAVAETQVAADPPAATDGSIPLGHFYLMQWQVYTGPSGASGPTGNTRKQVRFFSDATHHELVTADNGDVDTRESRTYSTAGTTLNSSQTCPTVDVVSNDYSVLGNGVALVLIGGNVVLTFARDEIFADGFQ